MSTSPTDDGLGPTPSPRSRRIGVGCAYAAQGIGYAAVLTALPTFQSTWSLSDTAVSLILLGTCVMAGIGSLAADVVSQRWGSRVGVTGALTVQAVAIGTLAFAPTFTLFIAAIVVYGIGLGTMDASENMQGAMVEAASGRAHLGRFYAAYTAASALGALAMSAFLSSAVGVIGALLTAVSVQVIMAVAAIFTLDPARERAARAESVHPTDAAELPPARTPLPRRAIWTVGLILMAAYMLDSSVSTWSTVYLTDSFGHLANLAPLGYAIYQGTTLVSRLVSDRLEERAGLARLALAAIVIGVVGCVVVAAIDTFVGAVLGFAIAGVAGGILIPLTFAAAGRILPARRDEIIARVNLFNYAGVIVGAAAIGAIAHGRGIGLGFLLPAVGLLAVVPLARLIAAGRAPQPVTAA